MLITIEGVDGVGKTSVLQGSSEFMGLYDRLAATSVHFAMTKEPGSGNAYVPFVSGEYPTTVDFYLWAAMQQTIHLQPELAVRVRYILGRVRSALDSAYEPQHWAVQHFTTPHPAYKSPRDAEYKAMLPEGLPSKHVFNTMDAIRLALMHADDSPTVPPTLSGLLFLANHLAHQEHIRTILHNGSNVLSDRYAESQIAYGRARGAHPIVEELYDKWGTMYPHHIILLTANPDVIEGRLTNRKERGEQTKQAGKNWNDPGLRTRAQEEYLKLSEDHPSVWTVIDTTDQRPQDIVQEITDLLLSF